MDDSLRQEFDWLFSGQGSGLVSEVEAMLGKRQNALRINKALRKKTTPVRAALVMEQAQLRLHGLNKFTCADQMFFTRRGLEQATSLPLARYKAARFRDIGTVADICCGIGGDLIALAGRQTADAHTVGIDSDELTAAIARHNLANVGTFNAEVRQQSFEDTDLSEFAGLHIDPDRRVKSRTVRGDFFQPKLQDVYGRINDTHTVAIKVAPATPWHDAMPENVQREWLGDQRECKQQILWSGPSTLKPGCVTGTMIANSGKVYTYSTQTQRVDAGRSAAGTEIGDAIYEPHAVMLISKLVSALAEDFGLKLISDQVDYLTGPLIETTPLLSQYKIAESLRLDIRQISAALRKFKVGEVVVKKRGVEQEIFNQLSRLKVAGENRATVIATRHNRKRIAFITNIEPRN